MTSMDPFQPKLFYSVLEIMLYRHSRNSEGSNIPISSSSSDNFDIVQHDVTAQEAAVHSVLKTVEEHSVYIHSSHFN